MSQLKLFCDGSVNPQKKIGFAAYFILNEKELKQNIKIRKFENTSSTKLELESLLWALKNENIIDENITIYTDCQNIIQLKSRREKLELNNYKTSTGKMIKNHELYKKFYELTDTINCLFIKVEGHKKSSKKDEIDILFNLVDKASRKALREYFNLKKYDE